MYIKTLTVSELTIYIKKVIDSDFILNNTHVKGEISNFKRHSSGHIYFSLKDDYGKINCIMFKSKADTLKFEPENGMKVVVKGKVSVYQKDGAYQLYCDELKLEGIGELSIAFEKLKNKLEQEGLFAAAHKKKIPQYSKNVGVVTSPTGAAVRDIINVITRRNSKINIKIYPALVQGANAAQSVISGINYLNQAENIDVIIIARGGGSIEELWSFNDEALANAIYNSKKPIVSAVGHETDFTIADFVSDLRAPTPSAAAEIVSLDLDTANREIEAYKGRLQKHVNIYLNAQLGKLQLLKKGMEYNSPQAFIVNSYIELDNINKMLNSAVNNKLAFEKEKLGKLHALIGAHNPLNVLNKGYAIIEDGNKKIISSIKSLDAENKVRIRLKDGTEVFNIQKDGNINGR